VTTAAVSVTPAEQRACSPSDSASAPLELFVFEGGFLLCRRGVWSSWTQSTTHTHTHTERNIWIEPIHVYPTTVSSLRGRMFECRPLRVCDSVTIYRAASRAYTHRQAAGLRGTNSAPVTVCTRTPDSIRLYPKCPSDKSQLIWSLRGVQTARAAKSVAFNEHFWSDAGGRQRQTDGSERTESPLAATHLNGKSHLYFKVATLKVERALPRWV